ncbi:MAG: TIGR02281 family clan AA aspartic protease [Gammaproteobacteria bacterium]
MANQPQVFARVMFIIAWVLAIGLLLTFFNYWLSQERNPNQNLQVDYTAGGQAQVVLQANRQHHYVFTGKINGVSVDFILDTGATNVSIPENIANDLKLPPGHPQNAVTANGTITVYTTRIDTLEIGPITLNNIKAHINPAMRSDQVLLGMSALQALDFSQSDGTLTLTQ